MKSEKKAFPKENYFMIKNQFTKNYPKILTAHYIILEYSVGIIEMIMYFKLTFFICLFCGKSVTHLPLSESFSRENMTHQEKL